MLRDARKRARLSQTALAERLGKSQSYVTKGEMGERRLEVVQMRASVIAVGVSPLEFMVDFEAKLSQD